jgi:HlyD family secretion protein
MRRRTWIITLSLAALGSVGTVYYRLGASTERPNVMTGVVTRGAIVETVEATGTLQPVDTVEVGSQVTGTVKTLGADFNSLVTEGQVLATLDPASLQAQVDQAAATVARLAAEVNRAKVTLADAETKLRRADALSRDQLISAADLDTARSTRDAAQASVVSAQAQVVQGRASLDQARVNIGHTIIRAPSAGVVLSRSVEVGQTVTSGLQTPTLFVIARDLQKMELQASVDEADIAHVAAGQVVAFTVDAHGARQFAGRVSQVRLQPIVAQNVVSYTTMVDVDNPDLALKPGMTATVRIQTARADDTLRVPAAAVRFRPTAEVLQAMGHAPNPAAGNGQARPQIANPSTGGLPRRSLGGGGRAAIWTLAGGRLERVAVEAGVSDGVLVAVKAPTLTEGAMVVTGVAASQATTASSQPSSGSPLVPTPQGRRGRR